MKTPYPKSYRLLEDDLEMIAKATGSSVEKLLDAITVSSRNDRVEAAKQTLAHFFKHPQMFTGSRDPNLLVWKAVDLCGDLARAARGFDFVTYCCYVAKMGATGPHSLIKQGDNDYDRVSQLLEKTIYDGYLEWFWNHLYLYSFEMVDPEVDGSLALRDVILEEVRSRTNPDHICFKQLMITGPSYRGGKTDSLGIYKIYVMRKPPSKVPWTFNTF